MFTFDYLIALSIFFCSHWGFFPLKEFDDNIKISVFLLFAIIVGNKFINWKDLKKERTKDSIIMAANTILITFKIQQDGYKDKGLIVF